MKTKNQLLKEAGLTVTPHPRGFRVTLFAHSGFEKVHQSVGTYDNRESAVETAADTAIGRHSFTRAEWDAAK